VKLLADESCDFRLVRALREAAYDVTAIAELARSITDDDVIAMARRDQRVLITEDKDFGQLVYAGGQVATGVILLRFPTQFASDWPRSSSRYSGTKAMSCRGGSPSWHPAA
jgi:predicted nuclease of predicted toxin-antitoxin system